MSELTRPMIDPSVIELTKFLAPIVASIIGAYFAYRAKADAAVAVQHVVELKHETTAVKEDVHKVELATNSMKDALVAAEKAKSLAEGMAQERQEQAVRDEAATLSRQKGVASEQKDQALRDSIPPRKEPLP